MNTRIRPLLVAVLSMLVALTAVVLAATAVLAQETAADTPSDPARFARGAQAWSSHCARCHNMRDPQELNDRQWEAVMAHMRVRAGLSAEQARDILAFLQGSN